MQNLRDLTSAEPTVATGNTYLPGITRTAVLKRFFQIPDTYPHTELSNLPTVFF